MSEFSYLSQKILEATTAVEPFEHIQIDNFLSEEHFEKVITNSQIHFEVVDTHEELIDTLKSQDYDIITFPGCKGENDIPEYLARLKTGVWTYKSGVPIDSFGMTFRLMNFKDEFVSSLVVYLNGDEFHDALRQRFNIRDETEIITAIQKNLTKYQISPHPDVSTKAMTYLININKNQDASLLPIHTHLLKFNPEYEYIYAEWEKGEYERVWVPWDWCETAKTHSENNSLIMFPPSPYTLHAVKLDYDHLKFQRTQLYGNLNYKTHKRKPYHPENYKGLIKK